MTLSPTYPKGQTIRGQNLRIQSVPEPVQQPVQQALGRGPIGRTHLRRNLPLQRACWQALPEQLRKSLSGQLQEHQNKEQYK
jgi:hypothetical protein